MERLTYLNERSTRWVPSFWNARKVKIIAELGDSSDPGVVPYLTSHALSTNAKTRDTARFAIARLLLAIPISRLSAFDLYSRRFTEDWRYRSDKWSALTPATIEMFRAENSKGVLAFASMHQNGRAREAALQLLAEQTDGQELPFLLLRANDWVAPIREQARTSISKRICAEYALQFLKCLPLVFQLERCERVSHQWLSEAVAELLTSAECEPVLQEGLASKDRKIRRACFQYIDTANLRPAKKSPLLDALDDADCMIRLWATRRLFATAKAEEMTILCERLKRDPFMPVRREVLHARIVSNDPQSFDSLKTALLDRNPAIRSFAHFYLKERFDVAQFYREAIARIEDANLATAIQGLGERGSEVDANEISHFLKSPEIRLRKASVSAIGALASYSFRDEFLHALADSSPGVSCAAYGALRPIATNVGIRQIAMLLAASYSIVTRKNALRLVSQFGKWEQISVYLSACRDPSEGISSTAVSQVRNWLSRYNRNFTAPQEQQITDTIRELRHSQEFLDSKTIMEFESLCKDWQK